MNPLHDWWSKDMNISEYLQVMVLDEDVLRGWRNRLNSEPEFEIDLDIELVEVPALNRLLRNSYGLKIVKDYDRVLVRSTYEA